MTLAGQVGQERREPDGVVVFDPSAFPKRCAGRFDGITRGPDAL